MGQGIHLHNQHVREGVSVEWNRVGPFQKEYTDKPTKRGVIFKSLVKSVCMIHTEEDFKVLHCGIQHRDLRLREAIVWDVKALKLIFHLLYISMVGDCPDVELFLF